MKVAPKPKALLGGVEHFGPTASFSQLQQSAKRSCRIRTPPSCQRHQDIRTPGHQDTAILLSFFLSSAVALFPLDSEFRLKSIFREAASNTFFLNGQFGAHFRGATCLCRKGRENDDVEYRGKTGEHMYDRLIAH